MNTIEADIASLTAKLASLRQLNGKEKAEAIKLMAELERLTKPPGTFDAAAVEKTDQVSESPLTQRRTFTPRSLGPDDGRMKQ